MPIVSFDFAGCRIPRGAFEKAETDNVGILFRNRAKEAESKDQA